MILFQKANNKGADQTARMRWSAPVFFPDRFSRDKAHLVYSNPLQTIFIHGSKHYEP